jgi:translation initiation factor IF-3
MRALDMARNDNLDLVEVGPTSVPPVCKLLDYGKFKYEQARKAREAKKSQKTQTIKEMRLKPKIGEHDLEFKTRLIKNFLEDGDKVKVTVNFRGRENAHPELGRAVLEEVARRLQGVGAVERMPLLEGRSMHMIMTPGAQKAKPAPRPVDRPEPVKG